MGASVALRLRGRTSTVDGHAHSPDGHHGLPRRSCSKKLTSEILKIQKDPPPGRGYTRRSMLVFAANSLMSDDSVHRSDSKSPHMRRSGSKASVLSVESRDHERASW